MSLTYFTNIYIPPPWPQNYQSLLSWSLLSTNSKLQTNQTQQRGLRSNIFQRRESNKWKQKHHKHHKHCHLCRAFESYIASQRDVCPEYINICAQQSGGVNICCPPYSYFSVYLGHYLGWRPGEPVLGHWAPTGTQLHLAHSLWTSEIRGQKSHLTLFRKYLTTS